MEFILPDDGFVIKRPTGQLVVTLEALAEGNILRFFDVNGEPRIALATQGDNAMVMIGASQTENVSLSASANSTELVVANSGKTIAVGIDEERSEIRFVNADDAITNKLYVDERGGQFGLGDQQGNLVLSAGAVERGGLLHVMNGNADTVIVLESKEDNGNITLLDEANNIRMMIGSKDDGDIHLVDSSGHVVWTTSQLRD